MNDPVNDTPGWQVVETEPFEAERQEAFLYLLRLNGPDYAGRWLTALLRAIEALPDFPGPRSNPLDEKNSERFQGEVRKLIFYGPSERRRRGIRYRLLYRLRAPDTSDMPGIIYLLRIRHGSASDDTQP